MPSLKTFDVFATVDYAQIAYLTGQVLAVNELDRTFIRGDEYILRFTLYHDTTGNTGFVIPAGAGLEFIVTDQFQVYDSDQIMAYAADSDFDPALWTDYDRSLGKVACFLNTNTTNLLADLGDEDEKNYRAALIMTIPGPDEPGNSSSSSLTSESSPTGPGEHVTLAQFVMTVTNDVWRLNQADPVTIVLKPYSLQSSSSSSSSSTVGLSTSSPSSSSTAALNTSDSSSSTSETSISSQSSTSVSSSSSTSTEQIKSSSSSSVGKSTTSTVGKSTTSTLSSSSSSSSTVGMSTSSPSSSSTVGLSTSSLSSSSTAVLSTSSISASSSSTVGRSTTSTVGQSTSSDSSSGDYTANMVLWLEADAAVVPTGTWSDKSGNSNDAALSGDAYVTKDEGLILDGTTDWATVSQSAELEFGTGDFSMAFWMKTSTNATMAGMSYGDRSDGAGCDLFAYHTSFGSVAIGVTDGTDSILSTGSTDTHDGSWHWVCFVADRDGNATLYIDAGAAEDTDDMTAVDSINTNDHDDWSIGRAWNGAAYAFYYTGTMDDIRLYNVALTSAQRDDIYDNSGHNPTRSSSSSSST